jgi:nucleotide-binding universal stress UspA family protein
MFEKIVVAYDGSEGSRKALHSACELVKVGASEVLALAVLEHLPKYAATVGEVEETQEQGRQYLNEVLTEAQELALAMQVDLRVDQVPGQAAQAIVRYAHEHESDLIVLGHSGHSGVWGAFLGTTADKVVRHAHCSVLIVR